MKCSSAPGYARRTLQKQAKLAFFSKCPFDASNKVLFGQTSVQQLDGVAHHHRKQMLMSLTTSDRIQKLAEINAQLWHRYLNKWKSQKHVVLYPELCNMLTGTVCKRAGIPLNESEIPERTKDLIVQIFFRLFAV